jgi:hypothetical protein
MGVEVLHSRAGDKTRADGMVENSAAAHLYFARTQSPDAMLPWGARNSLTPAALAALAVPRSRSTPLVHVDISSTQKASTASASPSTTSTAHSGAEDKRLLPSVAPKYAHSAASYWERQQSPALFSRGGASHRISACLPGKSMDSTFASQPASRHRITTPYVPGGGSRLHLGDDEVSSSPPATAPARLTNAQLLAVC